VFLDHQHSLLQPNMATLGSRRPSLSIHVDNAAPHVHSTSPNFQHSPLLFIAPPPTPDGQLAETRNSAVIIFNLQIQVQHLWQKLCDLETQVATCQHSTALLKDVSVNRQSTVTMSDFCIMPDDTSQSCGHDEEWKDLIRGLGWD
jgi:hypothetical protein